MNYQMRMGQYWLVAALCLVGNQVSAQNTNTLLANGGAKFAAARILLPFCEPEPTIGTSPYLPLGKGRDALPIFSYVHPGSPGGLIGLQVGDVVEAVDGVSLADVGWKNFSAKTWVPMLLQSAQENRPIELLVSRPKSDGARLRIQVVAELTCPLKVLEESDSWGFYKPYLAENTDRTVDHLMAYGQIKGMALNLLSSKSTGGRMQRSGMVLNLLGVVMGAPSSSALGTSTEASLYTDADHLKADFLMLYAMQRMGLAIADYPKWTQFKVDRAPSGMFKPRPREYSQAAKDRLQAITTLITEGRFAEAAEVVSFKLTPEQSASLSIKSTITPVTTPHDIAAPLPKESVTEKPIAQDMQKSSALEDASAPLLTKK